MSSRCLTARTTLLHPHNPQVLPFLVPALCRRRSDAEWAANAARFKFENRQTRRELKAIRDKIPATTSPESDQPSRALRDEAMSSPPPEPPPPQQQQRTTRLQHFADREVQVAARNMRSVQKVRGTEQVALEAVTAAGRRFTRHHLLLVPDAMRALERAFRELRDQVRMVEVDRGYRQQRMVVRWLLQDGRSVEAIRARARSQVAVHANAFFSTNLAFLVLYKGTLRLAGRVIEALADVPGAIILGRLYQVWVSERLWKFQKDRGVPENDRRMGLVAEDCVRMLIKMRNARSERDSGGIELPQNLVHQLALALPLPSLADAFWDIEKQFRYGFCITPNTTFHFVGRLLKKNQDTGESRWREAVKILKYMHYGKGHYLNTKQGKNSIYSALFQALCSRDEAATQELMELSSEVGIEHGSVLYNLLMARAMKEGDGDGLRAYFKAMVEDGYPPDLVSLTILHNFHKKTHNDPEREKVVQNAMEISGRLDKFLATDILHHMVIRRTPYEDVLSVYQRYFSTEILDKFGLAPPTYKDHKAVSKPKPDHVTLAVMFMSFCNNAKSVDKIWPLYLTYRGFLYTQRKWEDVHIHNRLLQNGTYMPHIIMMGLGRCYDGLPYVAQVLDHLIRQSSKVQPNVITWSIFLKFLTRAGKMAEAEGVMKIMRGRGLVPNTISWTTLLDAYVRENLVDEAESVLERMQSIDRVNPNAVTWTGMLRGYIKSNQDWKAGNAFRLMMEQGIHPEEKAIDVVAGVQDRMKFEAGLAGESESSEEVFEDGMVRWPGVVPTLEEQYKDAVSKAEMTAEAERRVMRTEEKGDGVFEEGEVKWPTPNSGDDGEGESK